MKINNIPLLFSTRSLPFVYPSERNEARTNKRKRVREKKIELKGRYACFILLSMI